MTEILRKSNEQKEGLKEHIQNPQKVAEKAWPNVTNITKGTALDQASSGTFWWGQKDGTNM